MVAMARTAVLLAVAAKGERRVRGWRRARRRTAALMVLRIGSRRGGVFVCSERAVFAPVLEGNNAWEKGAVSKTRVKQMAKHLSRCLCLLLVPVYVL